MKLVPGDGVPWGETMLTVDALLSACHTQPFTGPCPGIKVDVAVCLAPIGE
ncbi:MAG: hypothetical protein WBW62_12440 [Solirubrobacterales bacterium]